MDELKGALGTDADMTVFRKLREIDTVTSYSHRGSYYALRRVARFDDRGLWSCRSAYFSEVGSLLDTVVAWVSRAEQGFFAPELASELRVPVKDTLLTLVERERVVRETFRGRFLYLATDPEKRRDQRLRRDAATAQAEAQGEPGIPELSPIDDEVRASILIFYSLLDEQQRRLFAGLEALRIGRGGDRRIADLLGLDPHTVGRGRKALAKWDLHVDRVRRPGAGRPRLEKKPRK